MKVLPEHMSEYSVYACCLKRPGGRIPWDWSYRLQLVVTWVLDIISGSLQDQLVPLTTKASLQPGF